MLTISLSIICQLFCFFLGAGHMALAHLWRAKLSPGWRDRLANVGWALFLGGNYSSLRLRLAAGRFRCESNAGQHGYRQDCCENSCKDSFSCFHELSFSTIS